MLRRPRRLRATQALRNLVRETKYKNYIIYELNKEAFEETSKWFKKMSK